MKKRFLTINQWQRVYRKPDDDTGTGAGGDDAAEIAKMETEAAGNKNAELATAAAAAKADEEFLSPENTFTKEDFDKEEKTPEETDAAKKVANEKIASDKAAAEEKVKSDAAKKVKADEGKTAEAIVAEKKAADDAAAKKVEEGSDDDDTVLKVAEVPGDESDEESNWKTVGTALGFEVPEDNFEAFKKAQDDHIAAQVVEAKSAGLDAEIEELSKADPKVKEVLSFVKNGGKIDDYVNPMREYDELLALSDEALISAKLKLNKWDDDKIKEYVAGLKENGTLENASYSLRKDLETGKERTMNNLLANQQKLAETQAKTSADAKIKEDKQILDALGKITEYQGKKVTPEAVTAMAKKWSSGYYRQRFANDPDFVVRNILSHELAEQTVAAAKKAGFKEGLHKNQETLHNTPKNSQETGTRSTKQAEVKAGEGDFSSWSVDVNT